MSEKDLNNQTQADGDDNNYDTLYKIRPFLDLINNSFKAAFTPYQSISVAASDSATGYVWNFHSYIG